jgi:hypothetical protein
MNSKNIEFNVKAIDRIKYSGKDEIIPFGDGGVATLYRTRIS